MRAWDTGPAAPGRFKSFFRVCSHHGLPWPRRLIRRVSASRAYADRRRVRLARQDRQLQGPAMPGALPGGRRRRRGQASSEGQLGPRMSAGHRQRESRPSRAGRVAMGAPTGRAPTFLPAGVVALCRGRFPAKPALRFDSCHKETKCKSAAVPEAGFPETPAGRTRESLGGSFRRRLVGGLRGEQGQWRFDFPSPQTH